MNRDWFPYVERDVELAAFCSRKCYPAVILALAKTRDVEVLCSDAEHVNECLRAFPVIEHRNIVQDYVTEWRRASCAEKRPLMKQGAGRREANTWIRNLQPRDESRGER